MTWVKDSDDVARGETLRSAGKDAALLWFVAMRECARMDGDGLMSPLMVEDAAHLFRLKPGPTTARLVELGLWHNSDTARRCGPCRDQPSKPVPEGYVLIHEWWEHLVDAKGKDDKVHRLLDQARRALRKTTVGQKVAAWVRQRDEQECQYCAIVTRWDDVGQDRRSKDLGELDHVNPFLTTIEALNDPGNLVVACKGCNSDKKQRTPAQWAAAGGSLLRRSIEPNTDPAWVICDPISDPGHAITDLPRVARDSGPGTDPNRADPGSGPGVPDPSQAHELEGVTT